MAPSITAAWLDRPRRGQTSSVAPAQVTGMPRYNNRRTTRWLWPSTIAEVEVKAAVEKNDGHRQHPPWSERQPNVFSRFISLRKCPATNPAGSSKMMAGSPTRLDTIVQAHGEKGDRETESNEDVGLAHPPTAFARCATWHRFGSVCNGAGARLTNTLRAWPLSPHPVDEAAHGGAHGADRRTSRIAGAGDDGASRVLHCGWLEARTRRAPWQRKPTSRTGFPSTRA